MRRLGYVLTVGLCLMAPAAQVVSAQPSIEKLFLDAGAKERAVRAALADPAVTETVLKAVRTVVDDYESIVRRFPSSAYCDDALWRAGQLLLDAYGRFADPQDKTAAMRLLRTIVSEYPTSKFAKQAPGAIESAESRGGAPSNDSRPERAASSSAGPGPPVAVKTTGPERAASTRVVTIKDIRRIVLPDAIRIVIELDGEVPTFHDERLANPVRVFVDLTSTRPAPELVDRTIRFDGDADVVRQVRLGRHPNTITRVVVDASGISSYSVYPLYSPYRLVIDFIKEPTKMAPPAAPVRAEPPVAAAPVPATKPVVLTAARIVTQPPSPLQGRRIVGQVVPALFRPAPPRALRAVDRIVEPIVLAPLRASVIRPPGPITMVAVAARPALTLPAPVPVLPAKPVPTTATTTTPTSPAASPSTTTTPVVPTPSPASTVTASTATTTTPAATTTAPVVPAKPNIAGGFSMARQLGLGVSRIVIDPGHGGHDPGGVLRGTSEAEIVLDVALRLEKLLAKLSGVEVLLTRRTDEFLGLQERTAVANREGADLFLSIHANANTNKTASGVETYFLNFAPNASAAAIAARENAGSGQAMGALPDFVKMIALNNKMDESRDFATFVQRAMVEQLTPAHKGLKDLGVKQAPFVVLIGAAMPSALAEISFLTNAQEARLLRTTSYRQKIAEALFEAIRKYQTSLKTDTKVATQQ